MQSKADQLQTNDQVLSLTDQLNLGVRMIELDTHWFQVNPQGLGQGLEPHLHPCDATLAPPLSPLHSAPELLAMQSIMPACSC